MNVIEDIAFFFKNIFNISGFPAKWEMGNWESLHGWIHIISDCTIGIAFFAIPVMLFAFAIRKKEHLPFNYLFVLFSLFIFLCGTVHFIEASTFWHPWYRLSGFIKFLTAIVSILTAIELYRIIPEALELKTDQELQEAIKRNTLNLKKTAIALKRSNEDLENFAYVATHDIQEPVRMISQNIHRLQEHLKNYMDDKSNKYLAFINDGTELIQSLTIDLLEYSRIKSELIDFDFVDLNKVLDLAKESLLVRIQETKTEISSSKLPVIYGVESLLIRLFINLICNSIKYSDPNRNPKIEISYTKNNNFYIFKVKDNGIGFEQIHAEKIFKLFHRLHSKHEYSGSGIGLSSCQKIINYHQGEIWAESEPGKGSSFYFSLPVDKHEEDIY